MIYSCCFCGDSGVGKTALTSKIDQGGFSQHPAITIGTGFVTLTRPDDTRIQIWDTAGQEKYGCLMPMYFRSSQVFFVVYDITRAESFHRAIGYWYAEILGNAKTARPRIVLVGNKSDLELSRAVNVDDGMDAKTKLDIFAFVEVSAKHTSREQLCDIIHAMCVSCPFDNHTTYSEPPPRGAWGAHTLRMLADMPSSPSTCC